MFPLIDHKYNDEDFILVIIRLSSNNLEVIASTSKDRDDFRLQPSTSKHVRNLPNNTDYESSSPTLTIDPSTSD